MIKTHENDEYCMCCILRNWNIIKWCWIIWKSSITVEFYNLSIYDMARIVCEPNTIRTYLHKYVCKNRNSFWQSSRWLYYIYHIIYNSYLDIDFLKILCDNLNARLLYNLQFLYLFVNQCYPKYLIRSTNKKRRTLWWMIQNKKCALLNLWGKFHIQLSSLTKKANDVLLKVLYITAVMKCHQFRMTYFDDIGGQIALKCIYPPLR